MNPLRNNLEIWFGSHPKIGIPAYAVISILPIAITFANSDGANSKNNNNNQERRSDFRQHKARQFETAKQKKQISVFSITTLDIVMNLVVSTGLSSLLNLFSAKMQEKTSTSSSAFLQSWSQQNDFNGRIRGYFYKKFFRNFFFIPKSWTSYFFPSDPKTPQEFKYIISHKSEENNYNSGSSLTFSRVFVDHLQRNFIESIARASAISVGLLLLHIPKIRKILRPPEAMLLEQPGLMAQLSQKQQSSKIEDDDDENSNNNNGHDMQLQMIEALTTPTEGQTIDSLKWVWMGEFKVLVVNAVICGIVRKIMKNGENNQEVAAEVEFWVGNYLTFLVAKGIDLIVLMNSR